MAQYKLNKATAGSTSFRFGGVKYSTKTVTQKVLKQLHKDGFHAVEKVETKKPIINDTKKEDDNAND